MSLRVLLVGAGAVGQVYGRHLQKGGARVAFYVKPKYADEARQGFVMYPLQGAGKGRAVRFEGFDVLTTEAEVAAERWDQVWLCISSTALRSGWFDAFAGAIGEARVVNLLPGVEDRAFIAARVPPERVVASMIPFISYQSPLSGEHREPPGVAYWLPPLSSTPFSGPRDAVDAAVKVLRAGGMAAKRAGDVDRQKVWMSALLLPTIAALETVGWSLAAFRQSAEARRRASAAGREASDISAPGWRRLLAWGMTRPFNYRVMFWLGPKIAPLPLETYLRYHFTKVGDQTRAMLDTYARIAESRGQPHGAIDTLRSRLGPVG